MTNIDPSGGGPRNQQAPDTPGVMNQDTHELEEVSFTYQRIETETPAPGALSDATEPQQASAGDLADWQANYGTSGATNPGPPDGPASATPEEPAYGGPDSAPASDISQMDQMDLNESIKTTQQAMPADSSWAEVAPGPPEAPAADKPFEGGPLASAGQWIADEPGDAAPDDVAAQAQKVQPGDDTFQKVMPGDDQAGDGSVMPAPADQGQDHFVADSFSFGVEREMNESSEEAYSPPSDLQSAAEGKEEYLEVKLDNVMISSYQTSGSPDSPPGADAGIQDLMNQSETPGDSSAMPGDLSRVGFNPQPDPPVDVASSYGGPDTAPGDAADHEDWSDPIGVPMDATDGAKGGNVEFEWKVEEGESAPEDGGNEGIIIHDMPGPSAGGPNLIMASAQGALLPGDEDEMTTLGDLGVSEDVRELGAGPIIGAEGLADMDEDFDLPEI